MACVMSLGTLNTNVLVVQDSQLTGSALMLAELSDRSVADGLPDSSVDAALASVVPMLVSTCAHAAG